MQGIGTDTRAVRVASAGQAFFAATMMGLGVVGLVQRDFTPTWGGVPAGMPGYHALVDVTAVVSVALGAGLFWRRTEAVASRVLLGSFLAWLVVFRAPAVVRAPAATGAWWAAGDTAVMAAAAWVLYTWFAGDWDRRRFGFAVGSGGARLAMVLYGLGLIPFGVAHFTYLARTVSMVPSWLPWHLAWACVTGGAFIVAGVAVIVGVCGRLAAALAALQLGLFTLLVWGPVVVAGPDASQWAEFVSSWALTAGAWMVADSYREVPWLAVGTR